MSKLHDMIYWFGLAMTITGGASILILWAGFLIARVNHLVRDSINAIDGWRYVIDVRALRESREASKKAAAA